jgi:hypothetical protein
LEADIRLGKFTAIKALVLAGSLAGYKLTKVEERVLEHYLIKKRWGQWWWVFNKEEPLQEDLVAYDQFEELRDEKRKRDKWRDEQRAKRAGKIASSGKSGKGGITYNIPDPE